jgi:hypothetical protein
VKEMSAPQSLNVFQNYASPTDSQVFNKRSVLKINATVMTKNGREFTKIEQIDFNNEFTTRQRLPEPEQPLFWRILSSLFALITFSMFTKPPTPKFTDEKPLDKESALNLLTQSTIYWYSSGKSANYIKKDVEKVAKLLRFSKMSHHDKVFIYFALIVIMMEKGETQITFNRMKKHLHSFARPASSNCILREVATHLMTTNRALAKFDPKKVKPVHPGQPIRQETSTDDPEMENWGDLCSKDSSE